MTAVNFYRPTDRGLEARIREKLDALRASDRDQRASPPDRES